jgi:hypothetical protein
MRLILMQKQDVTALHTVGRDRVSNSARVAKRIVAINRPQGNYPGIAKCEEKKFFRQRTPGRAEILCRDLRTSCEQSILTSKDIGPVATPAVFGPHAVGEPVVANLMSFIQCPHHQFRISRSVFADEKHRAATSGSAQNVQQLRRMARVRAIVKSQCYLSLGTRAMVDDPGMAEKQRLKGQ